MRRALLGLVVAVLASLVVAAPANATVFREHFHGTIAEAGWFTSTSTSDTFTSVSASKSELFVDVFTETFDASGNFTGATDTFADVTGGFSFSINGKLSSAHVSGSDLPAQTCTYDADFNLVGCTDTTVSVDVSWTATGPLSHGTFNDHFKVDGFSFNDHFSGASRDATASGSVAGQALGADDLEFADLLRANSLSISRCIGANC